MLGLLAVGFIIWVAIWANTSNKPDQSERVLINVVVGFVLGCLLIPAFADLIDG